VGDDLEAEIAPTAASRAPIDRLIAVVDGVGGIYFSLTALVACVADVRRRPFRTSRSRSDRQWQAPAAPLPETRNRLLVTHSYTDMVTARMVAIDCGYEDADDLDALRHDPVLKIACERAPESGAGLPSQPTISRLENLADTRVLYRIAINHIDLFCRSYAAAPSSIVLDIDDTDDPDTAASSSRFSTRMRAVTASSRSTYSRATRASRSCL